MFTFKAARHLFQIPLLAASVLFLTGCEQVRTKVAELIAPQTPAQTLQTVHQLIDEGKFQQAKDKAGQRAEQTDSPMRSEFAWAAARASAFQGEVDTALRYLELAVQLQPLEPEAAMKDPAFEGLLTNVRFLQILTQGEASPRSRSTRAPSEAASATQDVSAGNVQIKQDGRGTEVRAGDVLIKMPN